MAKLSLVISNSVRRAAERPLSTNHARLSGEGDDATVIAATVGAIAYNGGRGGCRFDCIGCTEDSEERNQAGQKFMHHETSTPSPPPPPAASQHHSAH